MNLLTKSSQVINLLKDTLLNRKNKGFIWPTVILIRSLWEINFLFCSLWKKIRQRLFKTNPPLCNLLHIDVETLPLFFKFGLILGYKYLKCKHTKIINTFSHEVLKRNLYH